MSTKSVVITGAASGIGRALSDVFCKKDYTVIGLDVDLIGLKNFPGISFCVDVTQEKSVLECAQKIKNEIGAPSLWINNAGTVALGEFETVTSEAFKKVMSVNFDGVVHGTRAAIQVMTAGGTIVNISSVSGSVPGPFMSSYVASKHAVTGFTRALQLEYAEMKSPLKFILVAPGFVKTKIIDTHPVHKFPKWLKFTLATPEKTALKIYEGLLSGKPEIYPTLNGRVLQEINKWSPKIMRHTSRLFTAKSLREFLGIDEIRKN